MGPPPRGLAAEANDCFMVRPPPGPTEYKVAARSFARMAGSPRFVVVRRTRRHRWTLTDRATAIATTC